MKTALIAGATGIGALGLGMFAFKGGDKEGVDPATKDPSAESMARQPDPTGTAGASAPGTPATPGTPAAPGMPTAPGAVPAPAGQLQGQQVGPYTVVNDGGTQIVFETATQQPVGVLDAQGNLQAIQTDAQGNMTLAPAAPTASANAGAATSNIAAPTGFPTASAGSATAPTGGLGATPGQLQGQQVGPYTVVNEGGTQIVFETATQQPVGVLDAQGNLQAIQTDAQGNMTLAPPAGATTATVTPTAPTMSVPASPQFGTDAGQATGGGSYAGLAASLFADAPVAAGTVGAGPAGALSGSSQLGGTAPMVGAQPSPFPGLPQQQAGGFA